MQHMIWHRKICITLAIFFGWLLFVGEGRANAYQQDLTVRGSDSFSNLIVTPTGSALLVREGSSTLLVQFDRTNRVSLVQRREAMELTTFELPSKNGFYRASVVTFYPNKAIEKRFVRSGNKYRLVSLRVSNERRAFLTAEAGDAFPSDEPAIICPQAKDGGVTGLANIANAAALNSMCRRNFIQGTCEGRADEVASAFSEINSRTNQKYFSCFAQIKNYGEEHASLLAFVTAPSSPISISCTDKPKSSFSNSTIDLGVDAFLPPAEQNLRKALFHELTHSLNINGEEEVRAIESCCVSSDPRPRDCDNLRTFTHSLEALKEQFKVSDSALSKILEISADSKKRQQFIDEFNKLTESKSPSRLCALYNISATRCNTEFEPAFSLVHSSIINSKNTKDRVPSEGPAPLVSSQVSFRPGNPTLPTTFKPIIAKYQTASQAFAREARRFDAIDTSLIPSAQARTTRPTVRRAATSATATTRRSEPIEFNARIENVGSRETLLTLESAIGERSAPFSFSVPFTSTEFKTAEFRAAAPGAGTDREQSGRVAPLATRGSANAVDQNGAAPGAAASTGGGAGAPTASTLSSSGGSGRSLATDGPAAVRENPWLDRINSPSDIRNAFRESNGDELVRNTDFVATLFQKKFRVVYKCRAHGPGDFVSLVNIDPAGACPPPRGGN